MTANILMQGLRPGRTDQQIDEMAATYCMLGRYGDIEVFFTGEGQVIAL